MVVLKQKTDAAQMRVSPHCDLLDKIMIIVSAGFSAQHKAPHLLFLWVYNWFLFVVFIWHM